MSNQVNLKCTELKKSFNDGALSVEVLKGVDFAVLEGQCVGVVGSSGSGKSTLLHLLGGLDAPSSGTVAIRDKILHTLREPEISQVRNEELAFIYQFHHLMAEFSALENVAMPLLIRGVEIEQAHSQASQILADVGLGERLAHKPGELSGGERQRAAIARALVTKPGCILADEPTGNLDEHTAHSIFRLMLALSKKYTISMVMVTHNVSLLNDFDAVYLLKEGLLQTCQD